MNIIKPQRHDHNRKTISKNISDKLCINNYNSSNHQNYTAMSHEKLRNIKFKGVFADFEQTSNNDTAPYRSNHCDIPTFLHLSMGGVYQNNSGKINKIIFDCRDEIDKYCDSTELWWEINNNGIEHIDECTEEIRSIFYRACDELTNL